MCSRIFTAIWLAAMLMLSGPALGGGCCSRPVPADVPLTSGGASAAVVEGQYGRAPSLLADVDRLRTEGRLIGGNFLDPSYPRLTENTPLSIQTLRRIVTASEAGPEQGAARADIVRLGFVLLPTATQLAAIKVYVADTTAATGDKNTQSSETVRYLFENTLLVSRINSQKPVAAGAAPAPGSQYNNVADFARDMRGPARYADLPAEQRNLYDAMSAPMREAYLAMTPAQRTLAYTQIRPEAAPTIENNKGTPGKRK